jgi:hypothetical protein
VIKTAVGGRTLLTPVTKNGVDRLCNLVFVCSSQRQAPEYHADITPISPEYPKDINPKVRVSLNISIRKVVPTANHRGLSMQPSGFYSSISHHPHIHHHTTVTTQRIRGPTANDGSEDDFVPDDPRFVNCNPILITQTCHNPTSRECITTTFSVFLNDFLMDF